MLAVLKKYFLPLFNSSLSVAVVVTAPGKADQVSEELVKIGFDVEQKSLRLEVDEDGEYSDSESDQSR